MRADIEFERFVQREFNVVIEAGSAGSEIFAPLMFAIVWSIYLLVSKRVKNTYQSG